MDEETLKEQAARPTLERIRADSERVSPKLRPFLDTIRERLCDPSFNVAALWREHGVRNKSAASYFHELGTTPGKYLSDARMDVAAHLLAATHYQLWRVADLVGVSLRTLGRRFKDRHGQTPEDYRRNGSGIPGETAEAQLVQGVHGRRDKPDGDILAGTVQGILDRLCAFYPQPARSPASVILSGRDFEDFQVREKIWPELFDGELPFEEQRHRVLACRGFSTPAFYELLHQRSREEGRQDRRRGVELAQLALDSLEANAETLGAHYPVLRPQACAWLGNAYRLALDFSAADRAIDEAVKGLEKTRDPFAAGIVYMCRGTLRTFQRRHDEAVEIFDVAFPAFEEAGDEPWQIKTLVHRAAALDYAGRHELALETLAEASSLPGAAAKPFSVDLPFDIATALVQLDRFSEAERCLKTSSAVAGLDNVEWRWRWVQARVDHGLRRFNEAEIKYLSTVQALEELNEPLFSSLALLDLSVLHAERAENSKVIQICEKIYPVFAALKMYDETLASVRLLGDAISKNSVTLDVLRDLQSSMLRDPLIEMASPGSGGESQPPRQLPTV